MKMEMDLGDTRGKMSTIDRGVKKELPRSNG
jgi:hypothetical protein